MFDVCLGQFASVGGCTCSLGSAEHPRAQAQHCGACWVGGRLRRTNCSRRLFGTGAGFQKQIPGQDFFETVLYLEPERIVRPLQEGV